MLVARGGLVGLFSELLVFEQLLSLCHWDDELLSSPVAVCAGVRQRPHVRRVVLHDFCSLDSRNLGMTADCDGITRKFQQCLYFL